jgi:hypothetical protein
VSGGEGNKAEGVGSSIFGGVPKQRQPHTKPSRKAVALWLSAAQPLWLGRWGVARSECRRPADGAVRLEPAHPLGLWVTILAEKRGTYTGGLPCQLVP